jgi:beta-lactamase class A
VEDIETGQSAGANPNEPFLAASLIKVPVMAATFACWQDHPERRSRTTLNELEQMITVSDNACTDRLIDLVGGPEQVTSLCRHRGWDHLLVRHAILNHRGRGGTNLCTAREMTELLVALDKRELLGPEADEQMWEVLCRQKKRHRIPAGIPQLAGVVVGNKTGTLGNVLHDAAIVHTPQGRYAICILLSGQKSDAAGERFCRDVSRAVFNAMYTGPRTQLVASRESPKGG